MQYEFQSEGKLVVVYYKQPVTRNMYDALNRIYLNVNNLDTNRIVFYFFKDIYLP